MAVEETQTANYKIPKYISTDAPNLLDQYNEAMDTIDNKLLDTDGNVASNSTEISQMKTQIANLNEIVSGIDENKYLGFIGDSFAVDGTIPNRLGALMNMVAINMSQPGAGFVNAGTTQQDTFLQQAQKLRSNDNADNISEIIIYGGVNDLGNSATAINAAISNLCTYLYTNFPNAKKHFFLFNASPAYYSQLAGKQKSAVDTINASGSASVDGKAYLWFFNNASMLESDGLHPTSAGKIYIAGMIFNSLNGNSTVRKSITLTAAANCAVEATSQAYMQDGIVYIQAQASTTGDLEAGEFTNMINFNGNDIIVPANTSGYVCPFGTANGAAIDCMIRPAGYIALFNKSSSNIGGFGGALSAIMQVCPI